MGISLKDNVSFWLKFFWVLGLWALLLWKCQFGVDLTDEAYATSFGFKLIGGGDLPVVNEIYSAPRHYDFLNYFLVRPLLPFQLLYLRMAAVLSYALILLWFTWLCFRKNFAWSALLLYSLCLLFETVLIPSWSYNLWARNFILLQGGLLLSAFSREENRARYFFFAAGITQGLATLSYGALLPVALGMMGLSFVLRKFEGLNIQGAIFYAVGVLFVFCLDLFFIVSFWSNFKEAFQAMVELPIYSTVSSPSKLAEIMLWVVRLPELWLSLALCFVLQYRSPRAFGWTCVAAALGLTVWARLLISGWRLEQDTAHMIHVGPAFGAYVGLGTGLGIYLLVEKLKKKRGAALIAFLGLTSAAAMAMGSAAGTGAALWAMPLLIIAGFSHLRSQISKRPDRVENILWLSTLSLCTPLLVGGLHRQLIGTYYDVPPSQAMQILRVPPFHGLRTSVLRAESVGDLHRLVSGHSFVLAYPQLPGVFLMGKARSAANTVTVQENLIPEGQRRLLRRLRDESRIPSLIIRTHYRPWYWGISHADPFPLDFDQPLDAFLRCVQQSKESSKVHESPEFSAFTLPPQTALKCLSDILEGNET